MDIVTKTCTACLKEKPLNAFRSRGGKQNHLLKSRCNSCLYKQHKCWVEDNPTKVKAYREKDSWTLLKRCVRRNITPEQLVTQYEKQNECCAICKDHIELDNSAIDHNHNTGDFRGVLCKQCNRALGMFKDNITTLDNAVKYLKTFGSYGNGA